MPNSILDRFKSTTTMMDAEQELLALGGETVAVLASVLNGSAIDELGVPYRNLGLPLRCTLEVAKRMGPGAKPLEPLLRRELREGDFVAAQALGALGSVDEETVAELASHLDYDVNKSKDHVRALDLTCECAVSLIRLGHANHRAVTVVLESSSRAAADFARTMRFVNRNS